MLPIDLETMQTDTSKPDLAGLDLRDRQVQRQTTHPSHKRDLVEFATRHRKTKGLSRRIRYLLDRKNTAYQGYKRRSNGRMRRHIVQNEGRYATRYSDRYLEYPTFGWRKGVFVARYEDKRDEWCKGIFVWIKRGVYGTNRMKGRYIR